MIQGRSPERGTAFRGEFFLALAPKRTKKRFAATLRFAFIALIMRILIGDVAFETRDELEKCKKSAGDEWDNDEIYFVVEELRKYFSEISFMPVSYCAGILTLQR